MRPGPPRLTGRGRAGESGAAGKGCGPWYTLRVPSSCELLWEEAAERSCPSEGAGEGMRVRTWLGARVSYARVTR